MNGLILAGGQSSRLGTDKAFIKIDGIPIIERVLSVFKSLFDDCLIVTNSSDRYNYLKCSTVPDRYNNIGPLGGLQAGLSASSSSLNFVAACDMPFINPELIKHIMSFDGYEAVVPIANGLPEPLLAVYSRQCLPAIEEMIAAKTYKISRLYEKVRTKYVPEAELKKIDPELLTFTNINTLSAKKKYERLGPLKNP